MISRRFLIAALVTVLVAIGARNTFSTDSSAPIEAASSTRDDTGGVAPLTSPGQQSVSTSSDVVTSDGLFPTPEGSTATPTTVGSSASVELLELVDASRPPLSDTEVVDDGEHDPTHGRPATTTGATAATLVLSLWTWRFDDRAGRVREQLGGLADDALIERLAPTPEQEAARAAGGKVSWVIVREVTVEASVATVMFDHHLVTSTTAETITARVVDVTIVDGRAIEVTE